MSGGAVVRPSVAVPEDQVVRYTLLERVYHWIDAIAMDSSGNIYVSEPPKQHIWHITPQHEKKLAYDGKRIAFPNGVRLTPDQSQLIVAGTNHRNHTR